MGTLERLEDRLADLCGHRNVLDALLVRLVAEALETGVWEMPGIVLAVALACVESRPVGRARPAVGGGRPAA